MSVARLNRLNRKWPPPEQPPPGHIYGTLNINDTVTGRTIQFTGWIRQEYQQATSLQRLGEPIPPALLKIAMAEIKRIVEQETGVKVGLAVAAPYKTEPQQVQRPWAKGKK